MPPAPRTIARLIEDSSQDAAAFVRTVRGREAEPQIRALADFGIPPSSASCLTNAAWEDLRTYQAAVGEPAGAGWMDNTTLLTASRLLGDEGAKLMTPLTVWDLAAFACGVVCLEAIYHHEHPGIDDDELNAHFDDAVLRRVYLPRQKVAPGRILPDPWEGAHRHLCDVWSEAHDWLKRLQDAVGSPSPDAPQLEAIASAWRAALGDEDLHAADLVDAREVSLTWTSPSYRLLEEMVDVTGVDEAASFLDPDEKHVALAARRRELGLPDLAASTRRRLLSDLNLRAYINQRLAEFFELPYNSSLARLPFQRALYDRALEVQHQLQTAAVIDDRYARFAEGASLRLPVFLAVALRGCERREDLWDRLAKLRRRSKPFRARRAELDQALASGDLVAAGKLAKALETSASSVLAAAGKASANVSLAVLEQLAKGDLSALGLSVAALKGAESSGLSTSFVERLVWRLRRPELVWVSDLGEEARHLTEALPAFARLWKIPVNRTPVFKERFDKMRALAS